jgi:RHS repeat-associated protein
MTRILLGNDAAGKEIAEYSTVVANSTDAKVNYLTADHLGSPRINTDQNGTVIARHDYMPFGEEIGNIGGRNNGIDSVRKQFTGYEKDSESDLNYAKARYQDPNLGRFNSPDPAKMTKARISDPQHWNLYVYARNNPIMLIDITGEFPWTFYVRSFIQEAQKGPVAGDGRGPSTSSEVSSRISASYTLDYTSGRVTNSDVHSDVSILANPFGPVPLIDRSTPSMNLSHVVQLQDWKGVNMDYNGKFPITPSAMTPDIDMHSSIAIKETVSKFGDGVLSVSGNVSGDRFPSTEAFIVDQSGKNKVFLGAKFQEGDPVKDLWGDQKNKLMNVDLQIKFDKKGNFTAVISGGKTYSIEAWNKKIEAQF